MIRLTNEGLGPERVRLRIRYLESGALTTNFQPLLVCPNCVDHTRLRVSLPFEPRVAHSNVY